MLTPISKYPLLQKANSYEEICIACDMYGLRYVVLSEEVLCSNEIKKNYSFLMTFMFEKIARMNDIDLGWKSGIDEVL